MNLPDWLQQALVALIGAVGTACAGVVVWVIRLGNRVTNLEGAMRRHEVNQSETAREMVDALKELRAETRGLMEDIGSAREKALETFVTKADMRDIITAVRKTHEV